MVHYREPYKKLHIGLFRMANSEPKLYSHPRTGRLLFKLLASHWTEIAALMDVLHDKVWSSSLVLCVDFPTKGWFDRTDFKELQARMKAKQRWKVSEVVAEASKQNYCATYEAVDTSRYQKAPLCNVPLESRNKGVQYEENKDDGITRHC